jgi:AhpD family alkylhydroperoxidase
MSQESLYVRRTPGYSSKLFNQVPETVKAFSEFNKLALASGALTVRQKELVAIGIAHVTGCPYCIEAHVHKAKAEEAALEELIEAILVAAAVQSHAVFAHGANAAVAYEGGFGGDGGDLYPFSNVERSEQLAANAAEADPLTKFWAEALKPGRLNVKEKLYVALGTALVAGDPYGIEVYTGKAREAGITLQEIAEILFIAAVLNAGAVVAHRVNAVAAYERV